MKNLIEKLNILKQRVGDTMDNQSNVQKNEEEIDLRELIQVFWKKKFTIITITVIAAILAALVSLFLIKPTFHADFSVVLHMPENFHSKYGDYTLPISTNQEYINLIKSNDVLLYTLKDMEYDQAGITLEQLREKVSISIDQANKEQNVFSVKVAAGDPDEARRLAQALYDNYVEFLDITTIGSAIEYYNNQISISLSSLEVELDKTKEILTKNETLLAQTSPTINQKAAMDEIESDINNYVILERIVNPNYTAIETDIINNKQGINNIENSIRIYEQYVKELATIRDSITDYYTTGDFEYLGSYIVKVTDNSVYLPSEPVAPSQKTSPSNAMNVIIGTLLGGMIAVFVVLVQWWWKNGSEKETIELVDQVDSIEKLKSII